MEHIILPKRNYYLLAGTLIGKEGNSEGNNILLHIQNRILKDIYGPVPSEQISSLQTSSFSGENKERRNLLRAISEITKEEPPEDSSFLDCSAYTVMPGLVDCHVHLAFDGVDDEKAMTGWNEPESVQPLAASRFESLISNGILAVRDGGDQAGINLLLRKITQEKKIPGPLITATGNALRRRNSYGSLLGEAGDGDNVSRLALAGVDQIKVVTSGLVSIKEYGRVGPIHFSFEDLQVIVNKAHSLGLKVMAHADSDLAVDMSLRSGIDFIEHGYYISRESLLRMADLQRCWTPTLMPVYIWTIKPGVDPKYKNIAERIYRRHQEMIKRAFDLGITVGVGTDSGSPSIKHGELYYKELELYSEAGLSTGQIIRAAMTNGSFITGTSPGIQKCHPANLLVLEENPLQEGISALKKIKYTLHG